MMKLSIRSFQTVCRHLFCLCFLTVCVASTLAQGPPMHTLVPPVIPPSPDAAALGKYGSIPVSLHTGTPKISIPLYTIKTSSLELPISLNYHASGIKVTDVASWVGLGWTLDCGGVVSRSVVGKCDKGGFWTNPVKSTQQVDWINDYFYLRGIADNDYDAESDYYFYNFNGHSGKFVYRQNQGNSNPFLIPDQPIKVVAKPNGFHITDELGNLYKFEIAEETGSTVNSLYQSYESAYFLTRIVSADRKDSISFIYATDNDYTVGSSTDIETVGQQANPEGFISNGYHNVSSLPSSRDISSVRLLEVNYPNGKIEFVGDNSRLDLPKYRLQEIKIWSKNPNGTYTPQKSFVLGKEYFVSPGGSGTHFNRLKLPGITEKDPANGTSKVYRFYYDETVQLPALHSKAQDWWGFYNGKDGNTSLVAGETINFMSHPYTVGNGSDRNPNASKMQAGILKKIIYPTGGFTEFDYEPHSYAGGTTTTNPSETAESGQTGNTTTLLQQTKTFAVTTSGWAKVTTFCSNVTDAIPFYSYVSVRKQNSTQVLLEHRYDPAVYSPYNPELAKNFNVYLEAGNTYELKVMSKGQSSSTLMGGAAFSRATISWVETTGVSSSITGGLRVNEIRDSPGPAGPVVKKLYRYGKAVAGVETGNGVLLIPSDGLSSAKQENTFIYSEYTAPYCLEVSRGMKLTISGRAAYDLTLLSGSPVVYDRVAVYETSTAAPNGKQVFHFDVEPDQFGPSTKAYNNGRFQISNDWKGGDEIYNVVYKGNTTTKVVENTTVHGIYNPTEIVGTKVGWAVNFEGCGEPNAIGWQTGNNDWLYYVFDYPIYSGVKKLTSTKETQYSTTDPTKFVENQTDYRYNNLSSSHQQLSSRIVLNSDGNTYETKYWYPADYNSIENIPSLLTKNIIASPIKEETYLNNSIVQGKVSRLNADGKPYEIYQYESATPQTPPAHNAGTIIPAGYVKKVDIGYDATSKKINKVQPVDDANSAYLWGYNNSFPIAKAVNANVADVAVTSFESDAKGNWSYTGPVYSDIITKTGTFYYKLGGGSITKSLVAGKYKLEYWAKGTVNLAGGTIANVRTSAADANGWILYEKEVTVGSTTTFTISGTSTAFIDELRLYPVAAQVTSYTYNVLYGTTSVTDPANTIIYYEYDTFGRLKWVKDKDGNIVKAVDYHYKVN